MKLSSMSGHDPLKDAIILFVLLKGVEDRLVDFGRKLVKRNKTYAKTVFTKEVGGWTPFHAFVLRGERKMLKIALKAGVGVNFPMGKPEGVPGNCSPLHLAAHRGDVSVISILISNGADVNIRDDTGRVPLYYASRKQNTLAVKMLMRAGADLRQCGPEHKQSVSSESRQNPITYFLACSGDNRENRSTIFMKLSSMSGHDPLKDAIILFVLLKGEEDRLVDFGRKLVKRNKTYAKTVFTKEVGGWNPFHAFVLRGERKMLKIALKAGVGVNFPMGKPEGVPGNCSPLHLAAHRGDVSVISILISNGADVNIRDDTGRVPLYYASRKQNTLAVKMLMRAGADLRQCGPEHKQSVSSESRQNPITYFLACSGLRR